MQQLITLQDIACFEQYLQETGKSRNTIQKYMRDIQKFSKFLSDRDKCLSIDQVNVYIEQLKKESYSISSINTIICCLNTFCKFIGREEIHYSNIKKKKQAKDISAYLTAEEYERLLETTIHLKDYRFALLIQVIANTDLRMNEISFLTVESLIQGTVLVERVGETYEIPLPEQLIKGLCDYIAQADIKTGMIFRTSGGKAMDRGNIWRRLKGLAEMAGIDAAKVYPRNLKNKQAKKYYTIQY